MSFGHQDNPPNPFSGADVQQHGFNGKHRDWSINQYERPDEKKPGNAKDLELQSCERKESAGNDQDSQSQPRNDQNKTAKTNKCNCRHQQAATEPSRPEEKTESRKTEGESEDDTVGTEGLSIRLGLCCMFFELVSAFILDYLTYQADLYAAASQGVNWSVEELIDHGADSESLTSLNREAVYCLLCLEEFSRSQKLNLESKVDQP
ncbi:hypothetical protein FOXYSP1_14186 [Fusarium oxysporum f. sp. phaseoli]